MMKKKAKTNKAAEGRRHPRLQATFLAKYFLLDGTPGENVARTANTKDLSPSGVRFVTGEKVPQGALLRIQILIPVLGESPISVFARTLRVENETSDVYTVSADFLEIRDEDQKRLTEFLESRLRTREAEHLFSTGHVFTRAVSSENGNE